MNRYILILVSLFCATNLFAQELSPAEIDQLLQQIRQKRGANAEVKADFREEKTVRLMNKPIESSGTVWFQAPDKFRREVKGNSPSITVSNGQDLWIYYPKFKSAERYQLGKRSPVEAAIAGLTATLNLQGVEKNYHVSAARAADEYKLQLTPRHSSLKRFVQRFILTLNNNLQVERTEMAQPNGDRIVTLYSNETRGSIPASTFEFTPPEGTNVSTPLGR